MLSKSKSLFARVVHILSSGITFALLAVIAITIMSPRSTSLAAENTIPSGSAPQSSPMHSENSLLLPSFTVTKQDALLVDADGDTQADPGDTIGYTVDIANTGPDPATGVVFTDTIAASTTLVAGSVKTTPLARGDSYAALGNVRISQAVPGVLANDNDPDGGTVTVTAFDVTSAQGGNVVVNADGSFSYDPPAGYDGTDTFNYTITDDEGDTNSDTVTITISGMIWFINNNATACTVAGCGRLSNPFSTLTAFNALNNGTGNNPASGDNIFVYESGTGYSGAVTLLTGQRLIGQDATATLSTITGLTPPVGSDPLPAMNSGNATETSLTSTVTLNTNVTVRGLRIDSTASTGMNDPVGAISGVSVSEVKVVTTTGTGVNFSGTAGSLNFIQLTTSGGAGANLVGNTGGTFTFSTVSVSSGANAAFVATGGGTINVCDENPCNPAATGGLVNTLTSTTGTALNVANTTIGANNLEFRSISATGAVNGIVLNTTGATGRLVIAGNGGNCTSAGTCTGGAIQNTTGDGVSLTNTTGASLTRLFVGNSANHGINTSAINGLTLTSAYITNSGNGDNEHGLNLVNVQGTVTLDATTFNNASEDLVHLENNNVNATLNVINNSQFSHPGAVGGFANSAILLLPGGTSALTVSIQNSTFTNVRNAAAQIGANLLNSSGTQNFTFSNNTINITLPGRASGVTVSGQELTRTDITILGNNFSGAGGNGVISLDTNDTSIVRGLVSNNIISNPPGIGIFVAVDEAGRSDVTLDGNVITNAGGDGIQTVNFGGAGVSAMDMTIINNQVNGHSLNTGVNFVGGMSFTTFEDNSCIALRGNSVTGTPAGPTQCGGAPCVDYYLEEVGGVGTMEEIPNTGATTASAAYVNSINDAGPVTIFGIIDLTNGAVCDVTGLGLLPLSDPVPAQEPVEVEPVETEPEAVPATNVAAHLLNALSTTNVFSTPVTSETLFNQTGVELGMVEVNETSILSTNDLEVSTALLESPLVPSQSGETVNIVIGVLPPGKSITVRLNVTVDNPFPAGSSQVCNQSTILSNELPPVVSDDPDTGSVNDPTCTPIDAAPDLSIVKSDGGISSIPDGVINYTLTYSNTGNQHASGVTLSDTVPVGTTFNPTASTAGWGCVPNNNAGSVCTLNVGSVNVGAAAAAATFAVTVNNPVPAGLDAVSNTAAIDDDGTGGTDPTPANNSSTDTTPITANPDLTLSKDDGGATGTPGGVVAYTLTYTNTGNQGAANVTLTDTVPANSTFNPGASTAGWSCVPNNNAGSVCTLNVGTVNGGNAGGTATLAVTIINPVPAGVNQISNTAAVADDGANGADPTPGNNSDSDTTPINAAPDMSITKSDGGVTTTPGGTVAYTLNYANTGNQGATGVTLSETVPANSTFNAGASTAGWVCVPDNNAGSTCTLAIGAVAGGVGNGSAIFAITVANLVPAGVTQISNTASVADDGTNGADPTPGNNSGSDTTPVTATPDLTINKDDGGATGTPGNVVAYTLTYTNTGNQGSTGVVLNETVPTRTTFNPGASTAGWSCVPNNNPGSTCTLVIGAVAGGGGTGAATFAVTVINPVPTGVTQISNTASIADDGTNGADPTPGNNSSSDTTPINAAPDMQIAKSDGDIAFLPGDFITYTLTYQNVGDQDATGVTLTDTIPANTTFIPAASSVGWSCVPDNSAGSLCTLSIAAVGGGGSGGTAVFTVQVDDPAPGVILITNTAGVTDDGSNGADLNPADNTDTDTTPIANLPPTLTNVDITSPLSENGVATLSGDISDPEVDDAFTLMVDWGDGSTPDTFNYPAGTTSFSETHQYLDDNPTGTPSDDNTVSLSLSDGTNVVNANTAVTVNNIAPTLSSISATNANENGTVTLSGSFTDPGTQDTFTLAVDWGDGSSDTYNYLAGATSFSETHPYLDDDPSGTSADSYTISLTLTDDDTGSDTDSTTTTVSNVAPLLGNVAATAVIDEDDTVTLSGDISDPGPLDTFTLAVDWGDGITETFNYAAGTANFNETHQYLDDNPTGTPSDNYTIDLTLTDDDSGSDTDSDTVTVNNVAPLLTNLVAMPLTITETNSITLTGNIVDPGTQDTFTMTVDWADGNVETVNYPAGTTSFLLMHTYQDDALIALKAPEADFIIVATLTDDDNGSDSQSVTVTVDNAPPTLSTVAISSPVDEGSTATLSGAISDPSPLDSFTLLVDWGDGSSDTFNYGAGATSFSETHEYVDDDPTATSSDSYTVSLTLTDDNGGSDTDSATITVNNVAPTLGSVSVADVTENEVAMLTFTISDPGTADTFSLVVDWGDGITETFNYGASTTVVSQTHQYLDDDPSGTPADNYTISLVLTDDDTGSNADSTTVTVNNVAPVLSGLAATAVSENGTATLSGNITDPGTLDSFTVVVDWGDGITETLNYGAGTAVFSQTHLYPDDDPSGTPADDYTITVTITDDDTGTASETAVVTVSNIAPDLFNIAATPLNIPENNTITITGQISDAGTLDTFTLVIDWADGVTATMNFPAGTTTFLATHVYQDDGLRMLLTDFDISLTLIDDDTGSDTETITVQVDNVPPTLDNILISDTINEGDTATLTGDIGEVSPADTFTLTVAWGDGNVDSYGYGAGTTAFNESHVYVDDDPTATPADVYTVTLTLVDDNGGTAVQVTTLTVNNVAPQLSSVVITPALDENGGATLTGSFTDPGVTDTFTLTIAWGDGSTDMVATFGSGNSFTATHQYLDDDPTGTPFDSYNVNLTLTDDDSGSGSDTTTLTVNNVAPVVDAGVDQSVAANISVSFSGTFSDVGTLDTHTIEWDFGDGSTALGTLAPNHTYTAQGVYIVTLTVTDDDTGISSDQLVVTVIGGKLYLPFIAVSGGTTPGPDLVVSTLAASGSSITVVVTNQGDTAVTDAFWVDVYIDPDPVPTMVNQTWPLLADEGMVWGVAGITLNPGQSLTLTNNGTHYRTDLSNFSGSLVVGTPIFAQVDSAHAATTYGNVWENHEISGGAYNNITQTTAQ